MRVLVVNAGSSSLKLRLLDEHDALVASEDLPAPALPGGDAGSAPASVPTAVRSALERLGRADVVGHRVVHGGPDHRDAVEVDPGVLERLEALTDLAPLHQPRSIVGLRWLAAALPGTPQVACFDTAFHATLPDAAATYALPLAWRERWPLRRYGFHGLSHAYAARRTAELLGRPIGELRIVTCHLGAGASLAAVAGGRSVDTTMGFTPLEGLVMATRSGNVDPGLVLWLQDRGGLSRAEVYEGLEHGSGLRGLAGSDDMRAVLADAAAGIPVARLALDVYLHRLRAGIASMAAAMRGLDALVFTGGVGEHAPAIRTGAIDGLSFLGLRVDAAANEAGDEDREIGPADDTSPRVLVVTSREDLEIARQARALLRP